MQLSDPWCHALSGQHHLSVLRSDGRFLHMVPASYAVNTMSGIPPDSITRSGGLGLATILVGALQIRSA